MLALIIFVLVGALILWLGRDDGSTRPDSLTPQPPPPVSEPTQQTSQVQQITLPHDEPDFPPGKGRELFLSRCTVCHTLRYVTMQPNFPKKVWAKEVAKMINTFGAHISGAEAREITDYLATIKGPDSPPLAPPK